MPKTASSLTIPYEQTEFLPQPDPADTSRLYNEWLVEQKAEKLKGKYGGPCVTFARNFTGADKADVGGMARNVQTNTTTPEVGEIVKTNESKFGHLAVIIDIKEDGSIVVVESNYHWNGIIGIREIHKDSPVIVGYIIIN